MSIPESRVEAILSNILGEDYEVKLGKSRVEDLLIGLAGLIANCAQLDEEGLIPIEEIPPEVIERMYSVQDDTARFALTTDEVQNGDFVYVNSTQAMYLVIDDTHLNTEAGYKEFAGGIAARALADEDGVNFKQYYLKKADAFTPTTAQTNAMNSGIDSAKVSQIATNTAEIVGQENSTTDTVAGRGYAIINGIRLYANPSGTPPTGDIPDGSYGLF